MCYLKCNKIKMVCSSCLMYVLYLHLYSFDRVLVCYTRDTCEEHLRHGSVALASALLWWRCTACMLWYVPYRRPMCDLMSCHVMSCHVVSCCVMSCHVICYLIV